MSACPLSSPKTLLVGDSTAPFAAILEGEEGGIIGFLPSIVFSSFIEVFFLGLLWIFMKERKLRDS